MACVSKLLQAKAWFLLANVQLTTVSVEPWTMTLRSFCQRWQCAQVITHICRVVQGIYRVFTRVFGFLGLGERDSNEAVFLSFIGCIFSCWMDCEREAKYSVKSLAFSRVYSTQEVWFAYFRTIKYVDVMIFWLARKRARSRQLYTFVWKRFKNLQRCGRFICISYIDLFTG